MVDIRSITPIEFKSDISNIIEIELNVLKNQDSILFNNLIQHYNTLISKLRNSEHVLFLGAVLYEFGQTFLNLQFGDSYYNNKCALHYLSEANGIFLNLKHHKYIGASFNLIGVAYSNLPETAPEYPMSIQHAKKAFDGALTFLKPEHSEYIYISTLLNLAELLRKFEWENPENIEIAEKFYLKLLDLCHKESLPLKYAKVQNNLGIVYGQLAQKKGYEYYYKSINCFSEALRYRTEAFPLERAATLHNMALAYVNLKEYNTEYIEKAIHYATEALSFRNIDIDPYGYRVTAMLLGDIYILKGDEKSALSFYKNANNGSNKIFKLSIVPHSRENETKVNNKIYSQLVSSSIKLAQNDSSYSYSALLFAEEGKSREFLEQISKTDFPIPASISPVLIQEEKKYLTDLRQIHIKLSDQDLPYNDIIQYAKIKRNIENKLDSLWAKIIESSPSATDYINFRNSSPISHGELLEHLQLIDENVAIVSFFYTTDQITIFLLKKSLHSPIIHKIELSPHGLFDHYIECFFEDVHNSRENAKHSWLELGDILLKPLLANLNGIDVVYFIPHGALHLIPLHALIVNDVPFIKKFAVAYAPSISVLLKSLKRPILKTGAPIVMGYEPEENEIFLKEAKTIANLLGVDSLIGNYATKDNLIKNAPFASYIHLSCHGKFSGNPLKSSILLSDGEFTAYNWMELQLKSNLVTLSACETGISEIKTGDELYGFSRALLYAGASSVLLTLWPVYADTTAEWMEIFYKDILNDLSGNETTKAKAFQQATIKLFEEYKNPEIWAPFILIGNYR